MITWLPKVFCLSAALFVAVPAFATEAEWPPPAGPHGKPAPPPQSVPATPPEFSDEGFRKLKLQLKEEICRGEALPSRYDEETDRCMVFAIP